MRIFYHVMSAPQPLGLIFLAATERGVRHVEFMDRRSLKRTIAAHAAENPGATWEPSVREMRPLAEKLDQFFCGADTDLRMPLDPAGSEFQIDVWRALLAIPYGETRSYGDIAKAVGQPNSARAVGLAVNQNPLLILIPCHRVIGADGKLVGYSGGLPRKKYLLGLETRFKNMAPLEGDNVIAEMAVKVTKPAPPARTKSAAKKPAKGVASRPAASKPAPPKSASAVGGITRVKPATKAAARPRAAAAAAPARTVKLSAAPTRRGSR